MAAPTRVRDESLQNIAKSGTIGSLTGVMIAMKIWDAIFWVLTNPIVVFNIFLTLIPVGLAYAIVGLIHRSKSKPILKLPAVLLGFLWLAFLPNTCYLLTEWRHFLASFDPSDFFYGHRPNFDTTRRLLINVAFFLCYSGIGMITFTLAIRPLARLAKNMGYHLWLLGILLFPMASIGVYLGLILRFNSWEIVTQPGEIWFSVMQIAAYPQLSKFIVFFAGFLWLAYTTIDIWIDGLASRWEQISAKHISR